MESLVVIPARISALAGGVEDVSDSLEKLLGGIEAVRIFLDGRWEGEAAARFSQNMDRSLEKLGEYLEGTDVYAGQLHSCGSSFESCEREWREGF